MSRSWSDPPRPRRRHCLSWATENPLFGVAAVALIAGIIFLTVTVIREYTGPKKYVTVEFFDVDIGVTSGTTNISLDRVTYQPGFDIRLSNISRMESKPLVIIDGTISNDGTVPLVAFFLLVDHPAGVLVSKPDGEELTLQVSTTGVGLCPSESLPVPIINPGRSRRFNVSLPVERNSVWSWVKDEVRSGRLPALSFGPFAKGSCSTAEEGLPLDETWRFDFQPQNLPDVELRDYYPFGVPTASEVLVNGRNYWTDWLPRLE
jgi:hypothetical protein